METATGDVVEQQFSVSSPAQFTLNTVSGSVVVSPGEDGAIRVRATKSGREEARANTVIDLEQTGNAVSVHTHNRGASGILGRFGGQMASVDFVVSVPRSTSVEIKTVSADVRVSGTEGALRVQTVSGEVSVGDVQGDSQLTTVSGDVTAEGLAGTLTLHSTSGDARVAASTLRDFNLHSVSGDFYLDTPLTAGEHYYAHTVSGDLELAIPGGTGVTVQMKTVSGEVHTGFANAEIIKSGRRHWQGRINGGGANLEMQSVSGDLTIRGGEAGSGQHAAGQSGSDETGEPSRASEILRALEQGEIDVEQALSQLRGRR
jgi:DUF4097 and DUF4098 domain-containing protein YvlB